MDVHGGDAGEIANDAGGGDVDLVLDGAGLGAVVDAELGVAVIGAVGDEEF